MPFGGRSGFRPWFPFSLALPVFFAFCLSLFLPAVLLFATGSANAPDDLDAFVTAQLARRHVAGLSLAIVQDGKIVEARAYGVTDRGGNRPVGTSTLFQAGSISKSVSALGALHLVEHGKLDLDSDVNATLKSWKVPSSEFTMSKHVTLRGLLSHSAGLTVHGFPGYAADSTLPTLVQVLDGGRPANTAAIRNEAIPGAVWNYSGGGYTIMQQMIIDVTGQRFPDFMRQTVLAPIGMTQSSYEQPLPASLAAATAAGHYQDGKTVHGRWHVYPEMAAAGLWTTPSDLARFAIEVQQAYAGRSSKVISQAMAKQMLTDQKDMDGLGVFLQGSGPALRFTHGGRDEGFDADLTATAETGQGAAIMINANDDSRMVARIRNFIATRYHWPNTNTYAAPAMVAVPAAQLDEVTGRYELSNNQMVAFIAQDGRLFTSAGGMADEEFIPLGDDRFASADRNVRATFVRDASGVVTALTWTQGATTRTVPRVGPLFGAIVQQRDEDASLTSRVETVLRAMGHGGTALKTVPGLTEGVRKAFGVDGWRPAADLRRLSLPFKNHPPTTSRALRCRQLAIPATRASDAERDSQRRRPARARATGSSAPTIASPPRSIRRATSCAAARRFTTSTTRPMRLPYLWLQVEQNICAPNSITSILNQPPLVFGETAFDFSCGSFVGRPTLESAKVNGVDAKRTNYGTTMRIDLAKPLAPGASLDLEFAWHFTVPEQGAGRMGRDGALYEIAQWYPRMAVYDDVRGWNHEPYIGAGEFYLEYGSFDVTLTVPASYIVAATGELRNPEQVLTAAQRSRLALAHRSDTAIAIITRDEAGNTSRTRPANRPFTWHFTANNVRDFAWAAAPNWHVGGQQPRRHSHRDALPRHGGQVARSAQDGARRDQVLQRAVVSLSVLARDDGGRTGGRHGVSHAHLRREQLDARSPAVGARARVRARVVSR